MRRPHDVPAGSEELFRRMAATHGAERHTLRQQLVLGDTQDKHPALAARAAG